MSAARPELRSVGPSVGIRSSVVRGAVPVVCNMLAGTMGVNIVWGEFPTACTDGRTVFMPDLPLEGREMARWAYGYVAHEAAHLRATDFSADRGRDPLEIDLGNILEDARVERAICRDFPGARHWLEDLTQALLEEGLLGHVDPEDSLPRQVRKWLMYRSGTELMGYACLREMAVQQEALLSRVFQPALWQGLCECVSQVSLASNTTEVIAIARRIAQILHEAAAAEPAAPSNASTQPQGDVEGSAGSAAQEAPAPVPGEPQEGAGEDDSEEPQTAAQGGTPATDPAGQPVEAPADGRATSEASSAQLAALTNPDEWGKDATDKGSMAGGRLSQELARMRLESGARDGGVIHMPAVFEDRTLGDGQAAIASVRRQSTAVRALLEELLQGSAASRLRAARSGRRIGRDAGRRLRLGDLRIFDVRCPGLRIDAAVHLLQDVSGSMTSRMHAARAATLALCVAFSEVDGVDLAVSAFPWRVSGPRGVDPRGVILLKPAEESHRQAAARIEQLQAHGGTPLASALMHSHELLCGVARQRRIVIVVTDGDPDSTDDARRVIALGRRQGVEHLGLGIGVELGHLFDTFVRIDGIDDLPRQVVDLVRDAVLAGPASSGPG